MKNLLLIIVLLLSSRLYANDSMDCNSNDIKNNIVEMIAHQPPFNNFDLEGIVIIEFMVDDEHKIHITRIKSANTFLADHILESLENKVINCDCAMPGSIYALRLQYVQYS